MSFTYVASPYSDRLSINRLIRSSKTARFVGNLIANGEVAFSPIVHGHAIADMVKLPHDFDFWQNYCLTMLGAANKLVVLRLDGWDKSKGVAGEIKFAEEHGIPIEYADCK